MTRRWLLTGLGTMALLSGCAGFRNTKIDDRSFARLPEADRQAVLVSERPVNVAEANVTTAKVAKDEAKQFKDVSRHELDSAKSRLSAARAGRELGRRTNDWQTIRTAERSEDVARKQVLAARAKDDYANRLIKLRQAKVDEIEAQRDLAKKDVNFLKYRMLAKNHAADGLSERNILNDRQKAQEKLADRRLTVAQLDGETAFLKAVWDDRRRAYNVASAEGIQPIHAPAPPHLLPQPDPSEAPPPAPSEAPQK